MSEEMKMRYHALIEAAMSVPGKEISVHMNFKNKVFSASLIDSDFSRLDGVDLYGDISDAAYNIALQRINWWKEVEL